jgi:hypothetical protein
MAMTFQETVTTDILFYYDRYSNRLCGLVVRDPGCKPRGPAFNSRHYQIFCLAVGLKQGPINLMRINEELFEREIVAQV